MSGALTSKTVLTAIDAEPELPGDLPSEMWQKIQAMVLAGDSEGIAELLRIVVRETKNGIRARVSAIDLRAAVEPVAVPSKEPSPEWLLKARAEGRAEALTLLLDESAETFPDEYAGSHPIADTGDYGCHWKEDELRELFKVDENSWSLIDNLRGTYWDQQAEIDELKGRPAEPPDARCITTPDGGCVSSDCMHTDTPTNRAQARLDAARIVDAMSAAEARSALIDAITRASVPPNDLPADIQAEWERMARDAERYRFLRQPGNAIVYAKDRNAWGDNVSGHVAYKTAEELDAAIDVARRAETKDDGLWNPFGNDGMRHMENADVIGGATDETSEGRS